MNKLKMAVNNLSIAAQRAALLNPQQSLDTKHTRLYQEFGFPEYLDFAKFYAAFERMAAANAAVNITVDNTWQDYPTIESNNTEIESTRWIKKWYPKIKEGDKRNLVGRYSALLIQYKDGRRWDEPVDKAMLGRLKDKAIYDIIPAWETQLDPSEWYTDPADWENFGKVKRWYYYEGMVGDCKQPRSFDVHPDRVLIIAEGSEDGNPFSGIPLLRAGFNNLINSQKMTGAVAESFYKNAARQLKFLFDKDTSITDVAEGMGVSDAADVIEKLNETAEMLNRGFDSAASAIGGDIDAMVFQVPAPKEGWDINAQEFAASVYVPMRKLYGSEEGKQAADQDSKGFAQRCMSRRRWLSGVLSQLLYKWREYGIINLPDDFEVEWSDLLKPSLAEKLEMAHKMVLINKDAAHAGMGLVFTDDEAREIAEYKPLSEADKGLPDMPDEMVDEEI